jgi:CheY-like chemotaxis protein
MKAPAAFPPANIPAEHLAALSHEFRTPLNGVIGMTRLLAGTALSAEQSAYVAALAECGDHLLSLVNDVLDYARLGADHFELHPGVVHIEEVLRSVTELLSSRTHDKGIDIAWGAAPGLAPIMADEARLKQILLNFAGNAVKYVTTGGVLITADSPRRGRLRLTVADTGPGVPQALRERIFEAFVQADPAGGANLGGAGLGLAIARRIAEAMGGSVGVEAASGGGARFWFEASLRSAGPAPRERPLRGLTVAIASPSAIVRTAARLQIEASGGRATPAASLEEALATAPSAAVLLIDHAASPASRRPPPPPRGHAVILLAPEERALIPGFRRAGYAGYLIKPLRRASLVARVLAVISADAAPAVIEDDRIEAGDPPPQPGAAVHAGRRVLLAEDNPISAMLARTLLEREGCAVDHVADGEAAVEALGRGRYDLALMDVRMPVMGGKAATAAIRAAGVATPVVALTANAFEDDRLACLAAGMDDFLVKPLTPEALRAALARWIGGRWTKGPTRATLAS